MTVYSTRAFYQPLEKSVVELGLRKPNFTEPASKTREFPMNLIQSLWPLRIKILVIILSIIISASAAMAADRYAVVGEIANIRSGPGTNFEILTQAEKFYPVDIIERTGNWYQVVDFEDDVGWIHKSMVQKMPSVITVQPKCNIRSGPGMKFNIIYITKEGVPFKTIKKKGNWIHIQHSAGHKGWIHKSLVW